jgi:hypothetical protein
VFRGTSFIGGWEFIRVLEFTRCALVQYRGTILLGGLNLSRLLKSLEKGSGANPGLSPITNLSWRQEQKQKP